MEPEYIIYHLTPAEYFNGLPVDQPYLPREFERDGFIHCTKGEERLLLVADTLYRRVPGEFLALVIDERKVTSPIRYENVGGILFPHIYGPLNREAIWRVVAMGRRADGTFLPIGEPANGADAKAVAEARRSQARVEQLLAESADLRAKTLERLAQLERAIAALQGPAASAPTAPAATVEPATTGLTLEARVERLERELSTIKSEISNLGTVWLKPDVYAKSQTPKSRARSKRATVKARRPIARRSSLK